MPRLLLLLVVLVAGCQSSQPTAPADELEPEGETVEAERPPASPVATSPVSTKPLPPSQTAPVTRQTQPAKPPPQPDPRPTVADLSFLWAEYNANLAAAETVYAKKVVTAKSWDRELWRGKLEKRGRDYWWLEGVTEIDGTIIFGVECKLSADGSKQFGNMKPADHAKWQLTGTVTRSRVISRTIAGKKVNLPIVTIENCSFVRK